MNKTPKAPSDRATMRQVKQELRKCMVAYAKIIKVLASFDKPAQKRIIRATQIIFSSLIFFLSIACLPASNANPVALSIQKISVNANGSELATVSEETTNLSVPVLADPVKANSLTEKSRRQDAIGEPRESTTTANVLRLTHFGNEMSDRDSRGAQFISKESPAELYARLIAEDRPWTDPARIKL
jgi:hypothetical protein